MGIRSHFAIAVGKTSQWALKLFKGGSSLPGKLALKVDPHILDSLAKTTKSSLSPEQTVKH